LDSEHVSSYPVNVTKKEQAPSDYPRIGLKPQQDHPDHGLKQDEDMQMSQSYQVGGEAPREDLPSDPHAGRSATGASAGQGDALAAQQQELAMLRQQAAQQQELLMLRQQLAAVTPPQQEEISQPINQEATETAATPMGKGKGKGKPAVTGHTAVSEDLACLEMVFEVGGQDNTVRLFRRPLGAEFAKKGKGPTKIDRINGKSYASELGLQKGWIVKSVAGEDVTKMTFQQAQDAIVKGLLTLPTQTHS
jgi:hypothetical protein